ncbi:MAG: ADP-ribosylation/Crystallin [Chloroflexi bacterium]|nr:ADP-ribosylation/Crystallin [Chloroflexota bacterium]
MEKANDEMMLRTRFRAALLGGAIGDALGRPREGQQHLRFSPPWHVDDYQPAPDYVGGPVGTITDDTQLTMVVAESLIANGQLDPEDLARRLAAWLPVGRGMDKATQRAVERLAGGVPWDQAGEPSAGNGAAARAAPIGLLRFRQRDLLRREARLSAIPTQSEPMGIAGAVAMATATAWLLTREPGHWTVDGFIGAVQAAIKGIEQEPLAERRDPTVRTTLHDRIGKIPKLLRQPPERALSTLYNGAYVLESLPSALYSFLRSPDDMEQVLLLAANGTVDADSVAAMAGTLAGALGGEAAIPERLLPQLEYREDLIDLADKLHALATTE